jgi:hypothetical protein
MNLEEVRRHCERQIDLQRGRDPIWNSDQMLDVVSDLQRLIENQRTDPHILEQMRRLNEELAALYAENQRLMNILRNEEPDDEDPPNQLPGEPGGGDRVWPDPVGGPEDSDPYAQPDTLARRPDLS